MGILLWVGLSNLVGLHGHQPCGGYTCSLVNVLHSLLASNEGWESVFSLGCCPEVVNLILGAAWAATCEEPKLWVRGYELKLWVLI